ncbi:MAG: YigZ family protein [Bacteroidales bacterium]|nr:YigZ family protein [Bacteroidales bacterium]
MTRKIVPIKAVENELIIKKSRFIGNLKYVTTIEAARSFIVESKKKFKKANHNVPAFIIGHGNSVIEHCSDDGEPQSTAGHPILHVLKSKEIGDIVVVVTRYFGGIKLGKGGLVRAYSDTVIDLLQNTIWGEKLTIVEFEIVVDYRYFEQINKLLIQELVSNIHSEFLERVTIKGIIPQKLFEKVQIAVTNLLQNPDSIRTVKEREDVVPAKDFIIK